MAKTACREVKLPEGTVRVAGMTKGAGMIHPQMATTLGFVVSDARVTSAQLKKILGAAVESSYNRISIDGDTSTNDTLLLLANGASGVKPAGKGLALYQQVVTEVCQDLAKAIARDGEGARKLITIDVAGAKNADAAQRLARSIANSPLVKTAIAGSDANWGRIICAAGYAGVPFEPAQVDIWLQGVPVCRGGLAAPFSEEDLKRKLDEAEVEIRFSIRGGRTGTARFWTCDFTDEYIAINASYRT